MLMMFLVKCLTYAAALDKFLLLLMLHMNSDSLNDSIHNYMDVIGYSP